MQSVLHQIWRYLKFLKSWTKKMCWLLWFLLATAMWVAEKNLWFVSLSSNIFYLFCTFHERRGSSSTKGWCTTTTLPYMYLEVFLYAAHTSTHIDQVLLYRIAFSMISFYLLPTYLGQGMNQAQKLETSIVPYWHQIQVCPYPVVLISFCKSLNHIWICLNPVSLFFFSPLEDSYSSIDFESDRFISSQCYSSLVPIRTTPLPVEMNK